MEDLLISVATFNRKAVVDISLSNLKKYKQSSSIKIYDDCSTEYGSEFLSEFGPVYRSEVNLGIDAMKEFQFKDFLNTKFKYLYITDSDALHDPSFIDVLRNCPKDKPVTLYAPHNYSIPKKRITEDGKAHRMQYAGGISHLYTREMVEEICLYLEDNSFRDWDWHTIDILGSSMYATYTCYTDHLGKDGVHSWGSWNTDYAKNPTSYLQRLRADSIMYLEGCGDFPII
tara:strand:- start:1481 stop:2167 length:687 start_codon:yes stop_codon:yes gene_type:complete